MRKLVVVVLATAVAVTAGAIIQGSCAACGCTVADLVWGRGMDPGGLTLLYRDPHSGAYHTVHFSFVLQHAATAGLDITVERDWSAYKQEHLEEIRALEGAFTAPPVLGGLTVEGVLPDWVMLGEGASTTALEWTHVEEPLDGTHPCPNCGEGRFVFEQVGWWD